LGPWKLLRRGIDLKRFSFHLSSVAPSTITAPMDITLSEDDAILKEASLQVRAQVFVAAFMKSEIVIDADDKALLTPCGAAVSLDVHLERSLDIAVSSHQLDLVKAALARLKLDRETMTTTTSSKEVMTTAASTTVPSSSPTNRTRSVSGGTSSDAPKAPSIDPTITSSSGINSSKKETLPKSSPTAKRGLFGWMWDMVAEDDSEEDAKAEALAAQMARVQPTRDIAICAKLPGLTVHLANRRIDRLLGDVPSPSSSSSSSTIGSGMTMMQPTSVMSSGFIGGLSSPLRHQPTTHSPMTPHHHRLASTSSNAQSIITSAHNRTRSIAGAAAHTFAALHIRGIGLTLLKALPVPASAPASVRAIPMLPPSLALEVSSISLLDQTDRDARPVLMCGTDTSIRNAFPFLSIPSPPLSNTTNEPRVVAFPMNLCLHDHSTTTAIGVSPSLIPTSMGVPPPLVIASSDTTRGVPPSPPTTPKLGTSSTHKDNNRGSPLQHHNKEGSHGSALTLIHTAWLATNPHSSGLPRVRTATDVAVGTLAVMVDVATNGSAPIVAAVFQFLGLDLTKRNAATPPTPTPTPPPVVGNKTQRAINVKQLTVSVPGVSQPKPSLKTKPMIHSGLRLTLGHVLACVRVTDAFEWRFDRLHLRETDSLVLEMEGAMVKNAWTQPPDRMSSLSTKESVSASATPSATVPPSSRRGSLSGNSHRRTMASDTHRVDGVTLVGLRLGFKQLTFVDHCWQPRRMVPPSRRTSGSANTSSSIHGGGGGVGGHDFKDDINDEEEQQQQTGTSGLVLAISKLMVDLSVPFLPAERQSALAFFAASFLARSSHTSPGMASSLPSGTATSSMPGGRASLEIALDRVFASFSLQHLHFCFLVGSAITGLYDRSLAQFILDLRPRPATLHLDKRLCDSTLYFTLKRVAFRFAVSQLDDLPSDMALAPPSVERLLQLSGHVGSIVVSVERNSERRVLAVGPFRRADQQGENNKNIATPNLFTFSISTDEPMVSWVLALLGVVVRQKLEPLIGSPAPSLSGLAAATSTPGSGHHGDRRGSWSDNDGSTSSGDGLPGTEYRHRAIAQLASLAVVWDSIGLDAASFFYQLSLTITRGLLARRLARIAAAVASAPSSVDITTPVSEPQLSPTSTSMAPPSPGTSMFVAPTSTPSSAASDSELSIPIPAGQPQPNRSLSITTAPTPVSVGEMVRLLVAAVVNVFQLELTLQPSFLCFPLNDTFHLHRHPSYWLFKAVNPLMMQSPLISFTSTALCLQPPLMMSASSNTTGGLVRVPSAVTMAATEQVQIRLVIRGLHVYAREARAGIIGTPLQSSVPRSRSNSESISLLDSYFVGSASSTLLTSDIIAPWNLELVASLTAAPAAVASSLPSSPWIDAMVVGELVTQPLSAVLTLQSALAVSLLIDAVVPKFVQPLVPPSTNGQSVVLPPSTSTRPRSHVRSKTTDIKTSARSLAELAVALPPALPRTCLVPTRGRLKVAVGRLAIRMYPDCLSPAQIVTSDLLKLDLSSIGMIGEWDGAFGIRGEVTIGDSRLALMPWRTRTSDHPLSVIWSSRGAYLSVDRQRVSRVAVRASPLASPEPVELIHVHGYVQPIEIVLNTPVIKKVFTLLKSALPIRAPRDVTTSFTTTSAPSSSVTSTPLSSQASTESKTTTLPPSTTPSAQQAPSITTKPTVIADRRQLWICFQIDRILVSLPGIADSNGVTPSVGAELRRLWLHSAPTSVHPALLTHVQHMAARISSHHHALQSHYASPYLCSTCDSLRLLTVARPIHDSHFVLTGGLHEFTLFTGQWIPVAAPVVTPAITTITSSLHHTSPVERLHSHHRFDRRPLAEKVDINISLRLRLNGPVPVLAIDQTVTTTITHEAIAEVKHDDGSATGGPSYDIDTGVQVSGVRLRFSRESLSLVASVIKAIVSAPSIVASTPSQSAPPSTNMTNTVASTTSSSSTSAPIAPPTASSTTTNTAGSTQVTKKKPSLRVTVMLPLLSVELISASPPGTVQVSLSGLQLIHTITNKP
jgi:hypothetical protein